MRDNLLGYLLGALDGTEHNEVKRALERSPRLQQDLQDLEAKLAPLQRARWQHDPPEGLAERTCQLVSRLRDQQQAGHREVRRRDDLSPIAANEVAPIRHDWSNADMVIAAGLFLAAALLFFPAVAKSRQQARLIVCQRNLREIGNRLHQYSDTHQGFFPPVPATGKLAAAGTYAPALVEAGLLKDQSRLLCPSSRLAEQPSKFRVPTFAELQRAEGKALIRLQQIAGGSYGYTFGYVDGEQYVDVRNKGRAHFAIMADSPKPLGLRLPTNHGGGFNVLYEDGHVRYVTYGVPNDSVADDVFHNDRGRIEAGLHCDDSVIGDSASSPFPSSLPPAR